MDRPNILRRAGYTFSSIDKLCSPPVLPPASSGVRKCRRPLTSPRFLLSGVPKGTARQSPDMTDHDASYNHGGGVGPDTGKNIIACPPIAGGWVGLFPPGGQVHTGPISVKALDSSGKTLPNRERNKTLPREIGASLRTTLSGWIRAEIRVEPRSRMKTRQRQAQTPSLRRRMTSIVRFHAERVGWSARPSRKVDGPSVYIKGVGEARRRAFRIRSAGVILACVLDQPPAMYREVNPLQRWG